jgi:hypothetical protein
MPSAEWFPNAGDGAFTPLLVTRNAAAPPDVSRDLERQKVEARVRRACEAFWRP